MHNGLNPNTANAAFLENFSYGVTAAYIYWAYIRHAIQ